jgi:hypothetical protein
MQHTMTDARVAPFALPTEHLLAEPRRIDLMVRARVEAAHHRGHGMYSPTVADSRSSLVFPAPSPPTA